ncbi:MAG: UDP-glucose/GDP-mannose dehydrogenase family protein [Hylemonella sp.]|nr:UDP-glucose/GDP-mannose dehydrogenase family protein [Hylemonella sp.]
MKVSVIGAGYVGLVTASCLADMGHEVVCMDSDPRRVELLRSGVVPIYEPGLDSVIQRNTRDQRLFFTTRLPDALEACEVLFIAVGTPPKEDGSADLVHVLEVARQVGHSVTRPLVVVNKSTVPVGTAERVGAVLAEALAERGLSSLPLVVISNPEFLKEGAAIDDFMHPDRIVIGLPAGAPGEMARAAMTRLYASLNRHHERTVWMDVRSAELTKYAANAMLAARISFMNEMANLADLVGADVDAIRRGIGSDSRIGPSFLYAGTGYGGSCFPKDTRALMQTAQQHGSQMQLVEATERVNQAQRQILARRVMAHFGGDLRGRRFALWGLAFKPQTDDMREAPSRHLIRQLILRGAEVVAHDPVAMEAAQAVLAEDLADIRDGLSRLTLVGDAMSALDGADALLVVTEWKLFHNPDFGLIRQALRHPLIIDGRNLYDPQQLLEQGIAYQGIGRRNALASQAVPGVRLAADLAAELAESAPSMANV